MSPKAPDSSLRSNRMRLRSHSLIVAAVQEQVLAQALDRKQELASELAWLQVPPREPEQPLERERRPVSARALWGPAATSASTPCIHLTCLAEFASPLAGPFAGRKS